MEGSRGLWPLLRTALSMPREFYPDSPRPARRLWEEGAFSRFHDEKSIMDFVSSLPLLRLSAVRSRANDAVEVEILAVACTRIARVLKSWRTLRGLPPSRLLDMECLKRNDRVRTQFQFRTTIDY